MVDACQRIRLIVGASSGPALVVFGDRGGPHRIDDLRTVWQRWAHDVTVTSLPCGHFLAEERLAELIDLLRGFLEL